MFEELLADGWFLETASVYGRRYGTPIHQVREPMLTGQDVMLRLDVQGARELKRRYPGVIAIFVEPPSPEEAERRMRSRATESPQEIERRIAAMRDYELPFADEADFRVVNTTGDLERAAEPCVGIVTSVRRTPERTAVAARSDTGPTCGVAIVNATAFAYAEVIVAAGDVRGDQTFHYSVPDSLRGKLRPGQLVMAPFGARQLPGIVTALAKRSPVEETRDLLQVVWEPPLIGSRQLALARWVAARYGAPLRSSLDLVGPPRLVNHLHAEFTAVGPMSREGTWLGASSGSSTSCASTGRCPKPRCTASLGKTAATRGVARLVRLGLATRQVSLRPSGASCGAICQSLAAAKRRIAVRSAAACAEATSALGAPEPRRQSATGRPGIARRFGLGSFVAGTVARGLARIEKRWPATYIVDGLPGGSTGGAVPKSKAWSQIERFLQPDTAATLVIQGTETDRWPLYAAAIGRIASEGRQALVVAPDASTVAEMAEWLAARVGLAVADTTRASTPAQRVSLWRSLRAGEIDVLVGTRDATFAPLTRLGLVIVERDEDAGHKNRVAPRYHVPSAPPGWRQSSAVPCSWARKRPGWPYFMRWNPVRRAWSRPDPLFD